MLSARTIVVAGALTLGAGACQPKQPVQSAPPAGGADPIVTPASDDIAAKPTGEPVDKVEVRASLEGLDDVFLAVADLQKRIDPDNTTNVKAELEANLLAQGFAPAFLKNIDLSGLHAMWVAFPADQSAGPEAFDLSASLAVFDPRKVIEATPKSLKPSPLGDGVWEIRREQTQVLLKEAGKELLVGLSQADLKRAPGLRAEAGKGRRIRARAWNIPASEIDPADILDLPRDNPIVKKFTAVAKDLKAIEAEVDLGSKRALQMVAKIEAPWHKLGIDPVGKNRKKATALEKVLPAGAFFVTTFSWGDPTMIHKTIDSVIPFDQIPAPFSDIVRKAVKGAHGVLDQIANDVVLAFYIDGKGKASMLIAADIKNEGKTAEGIRNINGAVVDALQALITLQGSSEGGKFKVDYKKDGVRFGGVKADRLSVKLPKDVTDDLDAAAPFLKGNAVETVAFAKGSVAVVAIGAGARGVASQVAKNIGKSPSSSMATNSGLRALRSGIGGCQICMTGDFVEYLKLRLLIMEKSADDKGIAKDAKAHRTKITKFEPVLTGVGARVGKKKAAVGLVIPKKTLATSAGTIKALMNANDFVQNDGIKTVTSMAQPKKSDKKKAGKKKAIKKKTVKKKAGKKKADEKK